MQSIKKISAIETFPVRHPVLRSEKPIESCHFEGDNLETTTHFGQFDENKLIGVISIFEAKNKLFSEEKQFQIRGMAVLNEHQKKGLGASLVEHSEKYCLDNDADLIWFNARTEATGFYEKMNYQKIGSSFEIKEVGEHFVMFKKIKANPFQN